VVPLTNSRKRGNLMTRGRQRRGERGGEGRGGWLQLLQKMKNNWSEPLTQDKKEGERGRRKS